MNLAISGEWLFNGVVSIAVTFVGFWLRSVKEEIKELKSECNQIKENYQSKEMAQLNAKHSDDILREIRTELRAINQKLDKKADK
ncbi:hypothetical protein [Volucribacter amazonae]|uniref:Holin n=1 Tax=Volucribacter amazonae TaxID=256731 RepID=A0A9X4P9M6_9PAST|nr:hypothetical protein [Volucribacter amazonae]MDG6895053.1 hypothetical protein [Volucribacter amazonae]